MQSFSNFIVDCTAIASNAKNIKNLLSSNTKFCAIVKADAYGLGAKAVCKSLFGIADFFGVSSICEAVTIREIDNKTPILVLGASSVENLRYCQENNISVSVSSLDKLAEFIHFCNSNKKYLKVHLQLNTGLNRYGLNNNIQIKKALIAIRRCKYIKLEGVYSHFATKSQDIAYIYQQFQRFMSFKKLIKKDDVIFHIASSFATLLDDNMHLDMVRDGFLLYGGTTNNIGNKFVLTIESQIVNIVYAKPGETIGYDRLYTATKPTRVAVVPLGYADGIDSKLSNNFSVLINGEKCPIIGNICMDVFMVDITNIKAKPYDKVTLLGVNGDKNITIFDYAQKLKTSPYEVLLKFNYARMNYIVKE